MQRKEFENRIKSLLPKAADDVVESWAEYATELDQDGTEAAADFYDKNYVENGCDATPEEQKAFWDALTAFWAEENKENLS